MTKRVISEEGGRFFKKSGGAYVEVQPGGSTNATAIQGRAVSTETPLDGEALVFDSDAGTWGPAASQGGGIPEAPQDSKVYGRRNAAWTEADPAGAAAAVASALSSHAGAAVSVHGFDSAGKAPPASHDNAAHSTAYAASSDLSSHTGSAAPHSGHVQVGGQIGGTASSPDVRGIRETEGPTLLTLGAVTDGQYLRRSGSTITSGTPAGGSTPLWHGVLYSTMNGCDPLEMIREWTMTAVAGPTPTGIGTTVARCGLFRCPAAITVARIRLFGVGATSGLYKFAIYPKAVGSARTWESGAVNTTANAWLSISAGLPISLSSGAEYWWCVTVTSTGTTAGFRSLPAPVGSAFWGASAAPIGGRGLELGEFAQFAVTGGAFPATLPSLAVAGYAGGTTGSVPFALLDSVA